MGRSEVTVVMSGGLRTSVPSLSSLTTTPSPGPIPDVGSEAPRRPYPKTLVTGRTPDGDRTRRPFDGETGGLDPYSA